MPELLHTMHGSAQYLSAARALGTLLVVRELFWDPRIRSISPPFQTRAPL